MAKKGFEIKVTSKGEIRGVYRPQNKNEARG